MWRKGIVLSATFLLSILFITSCKKLENNIGQNNIDQNELLFSDGIDTFQITTYSYFDDSVISYSPSGASAFGVLGSYVDPVFGKYNAEIYTQLRLENFNPDFGDLSTITVDSFILSLEYLGQYGDAGVQDFEVYRLTDDMSTDSTYYSSDIVADDTGWNLVMPGQESVYLDSDHPTILDGDTVALPRPQVRIPLHTSVAKTMLIDAMSGAGYFADNEAFLDYFKGLHIKTNNPMQMSGDGGAFYFNLNDADSRLTIYYTQNGEQETFSLLINANGAKFNHVDINMDGSGTAVEAVINDTVSGQIQYYSQAYGSRAVVEVPGLSNLPANAVIHRAVLELPIEYQTGQNYAPGLDATVAVMLDDRLTSVNALAAYDDFRKSFQVDIRAYVQAIVNGELDNLGLIFSPLLHNSSAERIIFNGPNTFNKEKPKMYILYTEF